MKLTKRFGSLVLAGCLALSALPALAMDADVDTTGDAGAVVGEETALQSEDALKAEAQAAKGYYCTKKTAYLGDVYNETYYNERGKALKKLEYDSDGTSHLVYEYTYDANGNETKYIAYNSDGSVSQWEEKEYDANDNMTKYTSCNSDGSASSWVEYAYDASGNETKITRFDHGGTSYVSAEYAYDANGNTTKETYYDSDGSVSSSNEYAYDANGNTTKKTHYSSFGGITWNEYEYNAEGHLIKETCYDSAGSVGGSYEWVYDANDNLIKYIEYRSTGDVEKWTEYEYDANGNIIKETGWDDASGNVYVDDISTLVEYAYDANGNMTKETHYNSEGSAEYWYEYEYNEDGNKTRETTYSSDGTPHIAYEAVYDENGNRTYEKISQSDYEYYTYEYAKLSTNPFTDVTTDNWFYDSVLWAVNNGITLGTSDTTFSPDDGCTRAQIVTFLWRSAGSPTPTTSDNPFADVSADDWYYNAVLWAVENGITAGTSATTFSPNDTCIRSQAMTFIWRANGKQAAGDSNPFTDVATGEWYTDAVLWAVANGITKGTSDTTFGPNDTCTRSQIVTFLYRAA